VGAGKYTGKLNGHIEEMYTGHALVTAFGQREEAMATFTEQNEALYQASSRAQFISGTIQPLMMFMSNLNYVLVAVVGGLLIAGGSLTIGAVTAFIQYSRQFSQPLTQVASMANLLQSSVASAERVFALLDAPEQAPDEAEPARPDDVRGRVEFDDVSFRYAADRPLIEHVSLTVQPGETVAIVGPTGAGKTTLVNLLMRFYEIDSGAILLDGVNIAQMSREELRGLTGMVLQDAWLFGGTIEENIAYGSLGATHEQIVEAAKATYVDRFVRTLPDGYSTVLDDEGTNVSAGERQLITIARAFLARPAVLILDEATSSVDTRTEVLTARPVGTGRGLVLPRGRDRRRSAYRDPRRRRPLLRRRQPAPHGHHGRGGSVHPLRPARRPRRRLGRRRPSRGRRPALRAAAARVQPHRPRRVRAKLRVARPGRRHRRAAPVRARGAGDVPRRARRPGPGRRPGGQLTAQPPAHRDGRPPDPAPRPVPADRPRAAAISSGASVSKRPRLERRNPGWSRESKANCPASGTGSGRRLYVLLATEVGGAVSVPPN
jgi:ABC-type iron transport system FetAB ATPase subunit